MANSDIHDLSSFAYGNQVRPMTLIFAKDKSLESVREALFAGRMVAFFDNKLAGDAKYIEQLVAASLQVEVLDEHKGVLVVTNISDIEFSVLFEEHALPVIIHPRSAIRLTIPKGTTLNFVNCYIGRETLKKEIW